MEAEGNNTGWAGLAGQRQRQRQSLAQSAEWAAGRRSGMARLEEQVGAGAVDSRVWRTGPAVRAQVLSTWQRGWRSAGRFKGPQELLPDVREQVVPISPSLSRQQHKVPASTQQPGLDSHATDLGRPNMPIGGWLPAWAPPGTARATSVYDVPRGIKPARCPNRPVAGLSTSTEFKRNV